MTISAIAQSPAAAASQIAMRGRHKHGHHAASISDVDASGRNAAAAKSATGKIGDVLDMKA
jgi:hypothetical protein